MSEKSTVPATESATTVATAKTEEPAKLRRWDLMDVMTQMQNDLDRLWGGRFAALRPLRRFTESGETWSPRADVYEQNGNLVVKAELPGVKKEDITVAVEDGDLVIRGERTHEEKVEEKDYYRMERSTGAFYRRLPLPEGITVDQIAATYNDGVLEVTMPKPVTTTATPTTIPVK